MSGRPDRENAQGRQARWYRGVPARERVRRPRGTCRHEAQSREEIMATYPRAGASEVPAQPDFPELEQRALAYWTAHKTFGETIRNRENDSDFVFYVVPPFANGLPHYGHLLTGYVKDIVPRYKTMRGAKVDRRRRGGPPPAPPAGEGR